MGPQRSSSSTTYGVVAVASMAIVAALVWRHPHLDHSGDVHAAPTAAGTPSPVGDTAGDASVPAAKDVFEHATVNQPADPAATF